MEKSVSLSVCFELGKALRYSDAESFLTIYDSLLQDGSVEQDLQLIDVKEWSRQISELPQEDFELLHTAATLSPANNTCDVSIATSEPVALQLFSLIDKLRMMELVTSDSGAVSDYSETTDCKSQSSTSLTLELEEREGPRAGDLGRATDSVVQSNSLSLERKSSMTGTQVEIDRVCKEIEDLSIQEERLQVEPGGTDCCRVGEREEEDQQLSLNSATATSHHHVVELGDSKAKVSKKQLPDLRLQGEMEAEEDTSCQDVVGEEKGEREHRPAAVLNRDHTSTTHCQFELADSKREGNKRGQLEQFKVSKRVKENATIPPEAGTQQFRIKRKTKRYYGSNWRRNYGYYGNGRSRSQQSTFSPSSAKPSPCSTFNHEEVARFLWTRWTTVQKELSS